MAMDKDMWWMYIYMYIFIHIHTHTIGYYSAIKQKDILPPVTTWTYAK